MTATLTTTHARFAMLALESLLAALAAPSERSREELLASAFAEALEAERAAFTRAELAVARRLKSAISDGRLEGIA